MTEYQYITFDQKVTTWIRHLVQVRGVSTREEAIEKVKQSILRDNIFTDPDIFPVDLHELVDCEEPMTVEENGGESTIEILGNKNQPIWNNAEVS